LQGEGRGGGKGSIPKVKEERGATFVRKRKRGWGKPWNNYKGLLGEVETFQTMGI